MSTSHSAGWSRRSGRLVASAVGAIVFVVGPVGVATAPASAAPSGGGSGWSIEATPNHMEPTGALSSDSCPTTTMCMAVGSDANEPLAKLHDGTIWTDVSPPIPAGATASTLNGVSCPSDMACTAVGSDTSSSGADLPLAEVWGGTAWTVQNTPNPAGATTSSLSSVSCASPAVCVAVGGYTDSSGVSSSFAELRTGTAWTIQATPNPTGTTASSLFDVSCSSGRACMALGNFSDGAVTNATLAEVWNGKTWTIDDPSSTNGQVDAVSCTSATHCIAVGSRGTQLHLPAAFAEVWNGTTWTKQPIPSPPPSLLTTLTSVSCLSATSCTAVGYYGDMAQTFAAFTETWNGTAWTMQTPSNFNLGEVTLYGVSCPSASTCTAVGNAYVNPLVEVPLAEVRTGLAWVVQKLHDPKGVANNSLAAVSCPSATACTAVGERFRSSAKYIALVEVWNGTTWTFQSAPNPSGAIYGALDGLSCPSSTDCTAVGYYYTNGSQNPTAFAEGWNGKTWTVQTTPNPTGADNSSLTGVSCSSSATCTAVGDYVNGSGNYVSLAETWNGTTWTAQSTPNPTGATVSYLTGVSCPSATDCTAVGTYAKSSGRRVALAEAWNGTTWTIESIPNSAGAKSSSLAGVSCPSATACTAVGSYTKISGKSAPLAEMWDGTSWKTQTTPDLRGAGSSGLAGVSCPSTTACSAVGYAGSDVLAERWNGTEWRVQATPDPTGAIMSAFAGVSCPSETACTAAGTATNGSVIDQTLVEAENS